MQGTLKALMDMKKMIKKTLFIGLLTLGLILTSTQFVSATDSNFELEDAAGDVQLYDVENFVENVSAPHYDIQKLSCVKDGKNLEVELLLQDGGTFDTSAETLYMISIYSTTSFIGYMIAYPGFIFSMDIDQEITDETILDLLDSDPAVFDSNFDKYDSEFTDEGNKLTVSFELSSSSEKIIAVSVASMSTGLTDTNYTYYDDLPDGKGLGLLDFDIPTDIIIDSGDEYVADEGDTVQFEGEIVDGDATGYDWIWVFQDSQLTLEGQSPTHEFDIPGDYYGSVFIYDGEGNWGYSEFMVTINETAGPNHNNNNNNEPGFEAILVIAALAIVLVAFFIFRRKK